jgi:hypothetical protein
VRVWLVAGTVSKNHCRDKLFHAPAGEGWQQLKNLQDSA